MRLPFEVEKAIERKKITAYVVSHLPIVKAYAVKKDAAILIMEMGLILQAES